MRRFQIGPFTLLLKGTVLTLADRGDRIRLDAYQLSRQVKDGNQPMTLVVGSGAGKSTLMKTLLGIAPTTTGAVCLNGDNLRQHFDRYRTEIGYVLQDDIVHPHLTVEEVLDFACQLRLPPDSDRRQVVTQVLDQVQLSAVRQTLVQQLSGGQRKRVSIAVELLANPKLFFLDEPTSGLDPGLDKLMMMLLRRLADEGRTIILVTHASTLLFSDACPRFQVFPGYLHRPRPGQQSRSTTAGSRQLGNPLSSIPIVSNLCGHNPRFASPNHPVQP
jgi:ABC-type Mn2+/Zn2+ transport system ATPase subunit